MWLAICQILKIILYVMHVICVLARPVRRGMRRKEKTHGNINTINSHKTRHSWMWMSDQAQVLHFEYMVHYIHISMANGRGVAYSIHSFFEDIWAKARPQNIWGLCSIYKLPVVVPWQSVEAPHLKQLNYNDNNNSCSHVFDLFAFLAIRLVLSVAAWALQINRTNAQRWHSRKITLIYQRIM